MFVQIIIDHGHIPSDDITLGSFAFNMFGQDPLEVRVSMMEMKGLVGMMAPGAYCSLSKVYYKYKTLTLLCCKKMFLQHIVFPPF